MKNFRYFLLKFNYGVEIGAFKAYLGHFKRTDEAGIHKILREEYEHRETIYYILMAYGQAPSVLINLFFFLVGCSVGSLCRFCPLWSLDFIARTMESFAIFNYRKLAKLFPDHSSTFIRMAQAEERHKWYFSQKVGDKVS